MDEQELQLIVAKKQLRVHQISRSIYVVLVCIIGYLSYTHVVLYSAIVNGILTTLFAFLAYGQHLCVGDWQRAITDNLRIIADKKKDAGIN
jgi:hypothetical protein